MTEAEAGAGLAEALPDQVAQMPWPRMRSPGFADVLLAAARSRMRCITLGMIGRKMRREPVFQVLELVGQADDGVAGGEAPACIRRARRIRR